MEGAEGAQPACAGRLAVLRAVLSAGGAGLADQDGLMGGEGLQGLHRPSAP